MTCAERAKGPNSSHEIFDQSAEFVIELTIFCGPATCPQNNALRTAHPTALSRLVLSADGGYIPVRNPRSTSRGVITPLTRSHAALTAGRTVSHGNADPGRLRS